MSCSYKDYHEKCTKPYCKATDGECQFIKDDMDDICSIRDEYYGGSSEKSKKES